MMQVLLPPDSSEQHTSRSPLRYIPHRILSAREVKRRIHDSQVTAFTSSITSTQLGFHFMKLPRELRNIIYEMLPSPLCLRRLSLFFLSHKLGVIFPSRSPVSLMECYSLNLIATCEVFMSFLEPFGDSGSMDVVYQTRCSGQY